MTLSGWPAALDAFEAVLGEQEVLVRERRVEEVTAFEAPAGLGALPQELADRALSLHRRAQALSDEVWAQLARTGRQLTLAQKVAVVVNGPAYVDRRA